MTDEVCDIFKSISYYFNLIIGEYYLSTRAIITTTITPTISITTSSLSIELKIKPLAQWESWNKRLDRYEEKRKKVLSLTNHIIYKIQYFTFMYIFISLVVHTEYQVLAIHY